MKEKPTQEQIEAHFKKLKSEAESGGYFLNPDIEFTKGLIEGLLVNTSRFGYPVCPCRLASGVKEQDLDIICPCDYRDPDLEEFGACYCALYVSPEIARGQKTAQSIPERRLPLDKRQHQEHKLEQVKMGGLPLPVWRCKVCGYLCARETPPSICPICKVTKERFERFM